MHPKGQGWHIILEGQSRGFSFGKLIFLFVSFIPFSMCGVIVIVKGQVGEQ